MGLCQHLSLISEEQWENIGSGMRVKVVSSQECFDKWQDQLNRLKDKKDLKFIPQQKMLLPKQQLKSRNYCGKSQKQVNVQIIYPICQQLNQYLSNKQNQRFTQTQLITLLNSLIDVMMLCEKEAITSPNISIKDIFKTPESFLIYSKYSEPNVLESQSSAQSIVHKMGFILLQSGLSNNMEKELSINLLCFNKTYSSELTALVQQMLQKTPPTYQYITKKIKEIQHKY